jgi:hypothetical protein
VKLFDKLFRCCFHVENVKRPVQSNYHLYHRGHRRDGHFDALQLLPHDDGVV